MGNRAETTAEGLLGPREYEVMRYLWRESPASVGAVLDHLNGVRRRPEWLAYTTVMTVLARLHDKGFLDRVRRGRGYDYLPNYSEAELIELLSRREVADLLARYGDVAIAHFAAAIDDADPQVVAQLRRVAGRPHDD